MNGYKYFNNQGVRKMSSRPPKLSLPNLSLKEVSTLQPPLSQYRGGNASQFDFLYDFEPDEGQSEKLKIESEGPKSASKLGRHTLPQNKLDREFVSSVCKAITIVCDKLCASTFAKDLQKLISDIKQDKFGHIEGKDILLDNLAKRLIYFGSWEFLERSKIRGTILRDQIKNVRRVIPGEISLGTVALGSFDLRSVAQGSSSEKSRSLLLSFSSSGKASSRCGAEASASAVIVDSVAGKSPRAVAVSS